MTDESPIEVFDDVISKLLLAVEREETLQLMVYFDEQAIGNADSATQAAMDALQHAVMRPTGAEPSAQTLAGALHTLHMAWLIEDARDRAWALAAAVNHPLFTAQDRYDANHEAIEHRIDQLRGLVERL